MELEQILNQLSQIENINFGGCGIISYGLYKWLENNNQLKNTQICFIEEEYYFDRIDKNHILKGNAIGVGHVMLIHNNKWIDSDGIYDDPFDSLVIQNFEFEPNFYYVKDNIHEFMNCALFGDNWKNEWNYQFDREHYLPIIENILNINLTPSTNENSNQVHF